tara:strand:- start:1213 stop:1578 length:366 start_codon:yes stop_codon:yes gene_type:complete
MFSNPIAVFSPFALMNRLLLHPLLLASCVAMGSMAPVVLRSDPVRAVPSHLSRQSFVADAVARSGPAVVTLETARTVKKSALSGNTAGIADGSFIPSLLSDAGRACAATAGAAWPGQWCDF